MSAVQRLKQGFLRLPTAKKLIFIASLGLMISTVLPWYDNTNSFGAGAKYMGLQGPLFLVGYLILALGAINFFNMFAPLLGKNFDKLNKKTGTLSIIFGAQSALLLLIGNTVFLHPDFGISANTKSTSFGMTLAFISVGVLVISGWWVRRKEKSGEYEKHETAIQEEIHKESAPPIYNYQEPVYERPQAVQPNYDYEVPVNNSQENVQSTENTDPLTLDAKTRYRLMKQRERNAVNSQSNLWGGGSNNAFQRNPYGASQSPNNDRRLP